MNQIQLIIDTQTQDRPNQTSHADMSHTAPQCRTDSPDHLRSTSPASHLLHTLRPPLLNLGPDPSITIHSAQRDCIKPRKELEGISNGCRKTQTPREQTTHLPDTLRNQMSLCRLTSLVHLSHTFTAMRIDLVYYLFPRGRDYQFIPSGVVFTGSAALAPTIVVVVRRRYSQRQRAERRHSAQKV